MRPSMRLALTPNQKLGLLVAFVLTTGMLGMMVFAYRELRSQALDTARQRLIDVARELAQFLDQSTTARLELLHGAATDSSVTAFTAQPAGDPSGARIALARLVPAGDTRSTVELWDRTGRRLLVAGAVRPPPDSTTMRLTTSLVTADHPLAVSPLRITSDSVRFSSVAIIVDHGKTIGYVVQHQALGATAAARDRLTRLIGSQVAMFLGDANGAVWYDFSGPVSGPPVTITSDTSILSYRRPGTSGQIAAARDLQQAPWIVLVELPRATVFQRTNTFATRAGLTTSVMLAAVLVLGWRSSRRVTQPLEGALRESRARFQSVVEEAPNGILVTDRKGNIVLVNAAVERMFGYSRQELIGQSVELLVPHRARAQHEAERKVYNARPLRRPMGARRDLIGVTRRGVELPLEIGLSPIQDGNEPLVLASLVDISARRAAELELKRSNEDLQRFAYVASHDLQEPLRTVVSYVQLLERRYGTQLDQDAKDFIGFAVDGATRMQRMIEDLLTLSRVDTSGQGFSHTSAEAAVDAALVSLQASVEESGAGVTREALPDLFADPAQLKRLFTNLIGNALKFHGDAPPHVEILAKKKDRFWEFQVRDHGIGIAPDDLDRVFGIFQRLHSRSEYPGSGIGLAICRRIVERHGGRIWVDSTLGQGCTFFFTIPIREEAGA